MRNRFFLLGLLVILAGCAQEDNTPAPVTEAPKPIEETLDKVPPEQRESVRKTIEENRAKYGGPAYSDAMKNQGKK